MIAVLTVEVRRAWWVQLLSNPPGTPGATYLAEVGGRALTARTAARLQRTGYHAAGIRVLRMNAPGRRFIESRGGTPIEGPKAVRGHGRFSEVAYGWRDLASLARSCDPAFRSA